MPAETVPEGEATGATAEPAVEALPDVLPATGAPPQPAITARQRAAAAAASIFFLFIFIRILSSTEMFQAALCAAPVFVLLALLYPPKIKVTLNDSRSQKTITKYFIAKQNDNIVGFAGLKIILDEADLMNIVTKKCCRHEGIASNIMDKLIEYCKQEKIKCINLEVNIQNSIAINFYKKYNFKEVGLRKKYYDNTYDAILMKLEF